ncbi:MAG: hypothetical protein PVF13_09030, partial [Chromatiales bacterium]
IQAIVRHINKQRRKHGKEPILLRIGINSGLMLAGNIGIPDRLNILWWETRSTWLRGSAARRQPMVYCSAKRHRFSPVSTVWWSYTSNRP